MASTMCMTGGNFDIGHAVMVSERGILMPGSSVAPYAPTNITADVMQTVEEGPRDILQ